MRPLAEMFIKLLLITVTRTTATTVASPSETEHDLYLMGLFPWSGAWHGGESILSVATLAVDVVNNRTDILPGYKLHIVPSDTECDPGVGVKMLYDQLHTPPQKIMILGGACSAVSEIIAQAAHYWNLVQVSYASASPVLSNKEMFPLFARVAAPDVQVNPARIQFFKYFGWTRIATLSQLDPLFSATITHLLTLLRQQNFTVTRSEIFQEDPAVAVRNLKESDCRIIVGGFYEDKARKVFCEAYKQGLYGHRIVWMVNGWYDPNWFRADDPSIDCTPEQMAEAAEGAFDAGIAFMNPRNNQMSDAGFTPSEFMDAYYARVGGQKLFGEQIVAQGFDAVWAIGLALNNTMNKLKEMGSNKSLEDFTYDDDEMADLIFESLLNVSFMGLRGPISLDKNGDPVGLAELDRIQGGLRRTVVLYDPAKDDDSKLEWLPHNPVIWQGGSPPRDSTVTRIVYVTLSIPLYATMCALSALGVLLAAGFLAFNIVLRDVKIVRMSSPRLNNVILMGCISAYCSVLIQDAGGAHGEIGCEVKTVLLALGVSLTFGALFAKTWRVHVIFTNQKLRKRVVSDAHLFAMLGVLVAADMVVLVTWWIVDPRMLQITGVTSSLEEDDAGEVLIKSCERTCVSEYKLHFLGTLYGIHALILIFGTFLAWETRKVHYPELNDSKYIGMCIYNVALLCIPGVVVGVAIDTGVNLHYAIESALVLLGTTVTQLLIFVPKVAAYRQNKADGEDFRTQATHDGLSSARAPTVSTVMALKSNRRIFPRPEINC